MLKRLTVIAGGVLVGLAMTANVAGAAQSKCLVSKNKCVAKKLGGLSKCHQKAETPGKPADPNDAGCIDKVVAKYDGGVDPTKGCFAKLEAKVGNDCINTNNSASLESLADACVNAIINDIDPGTINQSKCNVGKKKCATSKLLGILKCYQKAETIGKPTDPNTGGCVDKVVAKYDGGADPTKGCFAKLEAKVGNDCVAPLGNSATVETTVDNTCVSNIIAALEAPPAPPTKLAFTNLAGTTNCGGITGGVTFTPPASAPFSGEIDSDLACTTKIADLGLGCLYIGGGGATSVPPGATPDHATNIFDISGPNLVASNGTSNLNCTKGAGPTSHCIGNTNFGTACTLDAQCGGNVGSCGLDPNCFFAGPLPILNGPLSTCVVNVIATDAGGTGDITTGTTSVNIPLASRVYLTGNSASPCPKCIASTCVGGLNNGGSCSAGGNTLGTSQDCPPANSTWLATLSVGLNPLTTGAATKTGAAGNFCPSPPATDPQQTGGAFGKTNAQCIKEVGSPAGDLRNGAPHPSKLASVFCIPKTGNPAIDPAANLPGPGAFSITGNAQALP